MWKIRSWERQMGQLWTAELCDLSPEDGAFTGDSDSDTYSPPGLSKIQISTRVSDYGFGCQPCLILRVGSD